MKIIIILIFGLIFVFFYFKYFIPIFLNFIQKLLNKVNFGGGRVNGYEKIKNKKIEDATYYVILDNLSNCIKCSNDLSNIKLKRDFAGFHYYKCDKCGIKMYKPLTKIYFYIYITLSLFFLLTSMSVFLNGGIPIPGLLAIFTFYSLIKDNEIKKIISESKKNINQKL